jgi:hypothetical protein
MRTDGQTDIAKLTVISCDFVTAPKNLNFAHTFKQQLQVGLCNAESVLLSGKGEGIPVHAINQEKRSCSAYS